MRGSRHRLARGVLPLAALVLSTAGCTQPDGIPPAPARAPHVHASRSGLPVRSPEPEPVPEQGLTPPSPREVLTVPSPAPPPQADRAVPPAGASGARGPRPSPEPGPAAGTSGLPPLPSLPSLPPVPRVPRMPPVPEGLPAEAAGEVCERLGSEAAAFCRSAYGGPGA